MKKRDQGGAGGRAAAAIEDALKGAMAAIQNRQPDAAERIARDALARDGRHPGALHMFGLAMLAQGRAREAVAPLEQAVRARADAVIETHLAIALRQLGQSEQALPLLERATARQPAFPMAFHELGVLLFSLRRLADAQAVLERGVEIAPAMPELSVVLGGVFLDRLDRPNAKLAFARALTYAPGHPGALYGLGTVLMDDGDFAAAADRFRQALTRDPGYAQARLGLGTCLLELGRWDEAIECLRAVVKAAPQLYTKALQTLVTAGRSRFWLKPSTAADMLRPK
jgi:tetratricopeptide (TPR) repeat protein